MAQEPISGTPVVIFAIPLIARDKAHDWAQVCANLKRTIGTLQRQTNPNWKAVICSQSKPDGITFDDQVRFLPFSEQIDGNDSTRKRREIANHCQSTETGDVYLFKLDADDFAHPALVEHLIETRATEGYLIDRGYMFDTASHRIAPLNRATKEAIRAQEGPLGLAMIPRRLNDLFRRVTGRNLAKFPPRLSKMRSFGSTCGSCVAWRYRCGDKDQANIIMPEIDHRLILPANQDGLMRLHPVPFNAMVYVVGHGENIQQTKGRLPYKIRYIDEFALPPHQAQQVLGEFGVS